VGDALTEVAERLYALPPEEFTAARNEAASAAKAAGDRGLASQLAQLRRPTVGAWLVNLLAHQRPDLISELLALGSALRTAQRNLRGDELRELSQRRREMVTSLSRQARALAVAAGRGVHDVLPLAEVEATLSAALAEPEIAEQVRLGRLTKTIDYAGFGEAPRPQLRLVQGGVDAPPSTVVDEPIREGAAAAGRGKKAGGTALAEPEGDTAAVERKAAEEEKRRADRERAARERMEARRQAQTAHRDLLAARTALAEAEAQRAAADKAVRAARRRVEAAQAAVEAARAAVEAAQAESPR
jgi:hypothetical protein